MLLTIDYLFSHVNLAEGEGLQMGVRSPYIWGNIFYQKLLHVLAKEGPSLGQNLSQSKKQPCKYFHTTMTCQGRINWANCFSPYWAIQLSQRLENWPRKKRSKKKLRQHTCYGLLTTLETTNTHIQICCTRPQKNWQLSYVTMKKSDLGKWGRMNQIFPSLLKRGYQNLVADRHVLSNSPAVFICYSNPIYLSISLTNHSSLF